LPEIIFGSGGRSGTLQEDYLAFDAQQLGQLPEFVGTLGARDRIVDRVKCVGDLPGLSQTLGHIGRGEPHEPWSRDQSLAKLFITRSSFLIE
jgi:hypothetical protein